MFFEQYEKVKQIYKMQSLFATKMYFYANRVALVYIVARFVKLLSFRFKGCTDVGVSNLNSRIQKIKFFWFFFSNRQIFTDRIESFQHWYRHSERNTPKKGIVALVFVYCFLLSQCASSFTSSSVNASVYVVDWLNVKTTKIKSHSVETATHKDLKTKKAFLSFLYLCAYFARSFRI